VTLHITLFDALHRRFRIVAFQAAHFSSESHKSSGGMELVSYLNFPMTLALDGLYNG